ncbi:MAG: GNAT family N-acetyltransferase [Victivallales bacterium]|nr:GNAT family N-acetyltransferase [Victivallales bacterium]
MKILLDLNIFKDVNKWNPWKINLHKEIFNYILLINFDLFIRKSQKKILFDLILAYNFNINCNLIDNDVKVIETMGEEDEYDVSTIEYLFKNKIIDLFVTNDSEIISSKCLNEYDVFVLTSYQFIQFLKNELNKNTKKMNSGTLWCTVDQLSLSDSIWNPLYNNYPNFEIWLRKIRDEKREAWVYSEAKQNDKLKIQAICIYHIEYNPIINIKDEILHGKILKICTFYVMEEVRGKRIAERLFFVAVQYAMQQGCRYIYVHTKDNALINFCSKYGFESKGECKISGRGDPDFVYVRSLKNNNYLFQPYNYYVISQNYPFFRFDEWIRKFVIRLSRKAQDKIFPNLFERIEHDILQKDEKHQLLLPLLCPDDLQSNSINKSFICRGKNDTIQQGDLLIFYCNNMKNDFLVIGIVEKFYTKINKEKIDYASAILSKRFEYNIHDLNHLLEYESTIILFRLLRFKKLESSSCEIVKQEIKKKSGNTLMPISTKFNHILPDILND